MDNHGSPWIIMVHHGESAGRKQTKVMLGSLGHEHACRPSISYQISTNRIPMIKSIILKGQNMVLTYPRGCLRAKY